MRENGVPSCFWPATLVLRILYPVAPFGTSGPDEIFVLNRIE
ncbi:hypothetical protein L843_2803 [Mycobacterium intracellulare MIN_061107_1834]|nr:hypothetical protein L843_2803 [Mycobacterium intracellulare MIN_061107_1834]